MTKTALVTGGNRGIGLEIVRKFAKEGCKVLLGCRKEESGEQAKEQIVGADIQIIEMDLTSPHTVLDTIVRAQAVFGPVDILINNAGVLYDDDYQDLELRDLEQSMQVHVKGPLTLIQHILPGMTERNFGRIVNVSSGWASFYEGMQGPLAYAVSKAALNAMTLQLANTVDTQKNVKINAMCPGWVHTRMGGKDAPKSPEEGADTAVWLGLLDEEGPSGQFFRDRKKINW